MTTAAGAGRASPLRLRMHVALTLAALFAVILQIKYRLPGSRALSILPLLSLLLFGLHALLIVRALVWGGRRGEVPASLVTIERASAVAVVAFFGFGLLLAANATLASSPTYYEAAEVTALAGVDSAFWGVVPYAWADLRYRAGGRVERVLLSGEERRRLWGGQAVEVRLRRGHFKIPWITEIAPDVERQSQAVLRETPGAARALYLLTHLYLARMQWNEGTATAVRYISLYPDNDGAARHFGEILDAFDRFPDVVAVLERVRRPDYDVSVLLGRALARVGRVAEGIALLERATSLQPDDPDAYRELGLIHLAAGDTARAVAMFEHVLRRQPRAPDVQAELRRLGKR